MAQEDFSSVTVHRTNKARLQKIVDAIVSTRPKAKRPRPVSFDEAIDLLLTEHEERQQS